MRKKCTYMFFGLIIVIAVSTGASALTALYLNIDGNARVLHAVGEVFVERYGGTPLFVVMDDLDGEGMEAVLRLSARTPVNVSTNRGHGPMIVFQGSGEFGYVDPNTGMLTTAERALGTIGFRWREDPGDVFEPDAVNLSPQLVIVGASNPKSYDGEIYPQILMTLDSDGLRLYSPDISYHADFDKMIQPKVFIGSDGTIYARKFVER